MNAANHEAPPNQSPAWWRRGKDSHRAYRIAGVHDRERFLMRAYFGLTAVGLVFAALRGAALSWDGSGYLFETLDKQTPFVPNGRLIDIPLQLPVLLVSRVTNDPGVLQTVFGLTYAAIPLIALAAAWWVVRDRARSLFVWAALGIELGMLPGQFDFTSEANIALQLFWPVLLALLTGLRRAHVPLVAALAIAVLASHPDAGALFILALVVALAIGLRHKGEERRMRRCAVAFGVLAVAALFVSSRSGYDAQQVSLDILRWSIAVSTSGLPTVALACALFVAAAVSAGPFAERRWGRHLILALHVIELVGIAAALLALAVWASDPHLWRWANKYSFPTLFVSLCFMAIAVFEGLVHAPDAARDAARDAHPVAELDWPHRIGTIQATALVFSIVLCIQSTTWFNLTGRLRETMDQNAWDCVSMAPLGWLQQTPLNQFATPDQSILLQGRVPQKVVLAGNGCGDAAFSEGVRLNQYALRGWNQGWFDLRALGGRLVADRDIARGCSFMLSTGWYTTETDGSYWWRWSNGRDARIRILVDRATTVFMNGQIESIRYPNRVDVRLNGQKLTTLDITSKGLQPAGPLPLALGRGANVIQFASRNAAVAVEGRPLAIDLANATMVSGDNHMECDLHP